MLKAAKSPKFMKTHLGITFAFELGMKGSG